MSRSTGIYSDNVKHLERVTFFLITVYTYMHDLGSLVPAFYMSGPSQYYCC